MSVDDTNLDSDPDGSVVRTQIYTGDVGDETEGSVPFVQLKGPGSSQSTVFGDGARIRVTVDEDGVTVTASAELDDPERLLDRDILSVVLCGKNLPEEGDQR